jgi:hypothetical protein
MRDTLYILIYTIAGFIAFFCVFGGIFLVFYWFGIGKKNIALEVGLMAGCAFSLGSLLCFLSGKR